MALAFLGKQNSCSCCTTTLLSALVTAGHNTPAGQPRVDVTIAHNPYSSPKAGPCSGWKRVTAFLFLFPISLVPVSCHPGSFSNSLALFDFSCRASTTPTSDPSLFRVLAPFSFLLFTHPNIVRKFHLLLSFSCRGFIRSPWMDA